jgi:hypothetical protein
MHSSMQNIIFCYVLYLCLILKALVWNFRYYKQIFLFLFYKMSGFMQYLLNLLNVFFIHWPQFEDICSEKMYFILGFMNVDRNWEEVQLSSRWMWLIDTMRSFVNVLLSPFNRNLCRDDTNKVDVESWLEVGRRTKIQNILKNPFYQK